MRIEVYRDRGDFDKAKEEVRWYIRYYNDNEVKDPDDLLILGLASLEHARWNKLSDQFQFVLDELFGDAAKPPKDSKEEKSYWPAEYEAGALLLEKYNRGEALDAFDKALTINPNCAEALVGKGDAALMKFEVKDAEDFAEQRLKVNPNLPEALRLRADVHLAAGDAAAALKELERARKVNPRDETHPGPHRRLPIPAAKEQGSYEALTAGSRRSSTRKPAVFYYRAGRTARRAPPLRRRREVLPEGGGTAAAWPGRSTASACSTCAWAARRRPANC